jgi:hypothetical protein
MTSDHSEGHSLFALVCIIPHSFHPILSVPCCICISQSETMVLLGHNFL